jgi:hypothetical protein
MSIVYVYRSATAESPVKIADTLKLSIGVIVVGSLDCGRERLWSIISMEA